MALRIDIQKHIGNEELTNIGVLAASLIEAMHEHGEVTMFTDESFSAVDFGLVLLVDELIDHYDWDRSKITLAYGNRIEVGTIPQFNTELFFPVTGAGNSIIVPPDTLPWNGEFDFGMFIGRLNMTRLHAIEEFRNFKYKHRGISSMNQAPAEDATCDKSMLAYLKASDTKWSDIKDLKAYSDIGAVQSPPIVSPMAGWEHIYKKIGIEIICETNYGYNNAVITEKTVRCCLYKRPFMIIGSPGLMHSIQTDDWGMVKPLRFFEDVIPLNYDNLYGKERVDAVFEILEDLIETGKINTILDDCKRDIEHNHKVACYDVTGKSYEKRQAARKYKEI